MEPAPTTNWKVNPILIVIAGFTGGVFFSSFFTLQPLYSLLILVVAGAVLGAEKIYTHQLNREIIILALILISFGFGALRYAVKDFHELQVPAPTGLVVSEPVGKENATQFIYRADNGEKVLVNAALYAPVAYGDRITLSGSFKQPGMIEGEAGKKDFDYGAYLAKDNIYWTLSFATIEVLGHGEGNVVKAWLFKIKKNFTEHTRRMLAEPYASLLLGLIVAGRDALPAGILEEFRRAGVIHVVVLSGYNITIIAEFLRKTLQKIFLWCRLPVVPQAAAGVSLLGILLFALMTGAEATVVRAALMATIVIGAKFVGRGYSAPRALIFAGFLMLLQNPKILVFDPSFQLSFLATLGLIYMVPVVEQWVKWVPEKWELKGLLIQTIATQMTVLPLLIYSVGDVSLVSLPANLLILLIVPFTMLLGFTAILLSYLGTVIAWPLAFVSYLLLAWILGVAHVLGSLSFATVKMPNVSAWVIGFIYFSLASLLYWLYGQEHYRKNSLLRQTRPE
jgi:competence protein ComEC